VIDEPQQRLRRLHFLSVQKVEEVAHNHQTDAVDANQSWEKKAFHLMFPFQ